MYVARKIDKYGDWVYYKCRGHGPARKGCGTSIPVQSLNTAVDTIMASDKRPHMTTEIAVGDDNSERRALLLEKSKAAMDDGDLGLSIQLTQEAMAIPPSERKSTTRSVPSGKTVGQHWQTLTIAEKRDELLRWTVLASPGNVKVVGPWHDNGGTFIGDDTHWA
jgi:hypothetical protein